MIDSVEIGNSSIGPGNPCFIIAEAGVNHNGDTRLAHRLVDAAANAGADAVKFQTFIPETVVVRNAQKPSYQLKTTDKNESQLEMLQNLSLTYEDFHTLKKHADDVGILFLSTPSSPADINFLMKIGVSALKIASMDIVNYPLLNVFGSQGVPIIASTGMATLGEVEKGVAILRNGGCQELALLHCATNYPVQDDEANLLVLETLAQAFQVPVGYSDHTSGILVAIAAVAREAHIIEKHFTIDKQLPGPDHAASLDEEGFGAMVRGIRTVEAALGSPIKQEVKAEAANRSVMRRSLVAAKDIPANTIIRSHHITLKRPGTGLGAELIPFFVGRRTTRSLEKDQMISLDVLLPCNSQTLKE